MAVETNVFPLFEVEDGKRYTINHKPHRLPVQEYLLKWGRFRHLREEQIRQIQLDVDEEWEKLRHQATRFTNWNKGRYIPVPPSNPPNFLLYWSRFLWN